MKVITKNFIDCSEVTEKYTKYPITVYTDNNNNCYVTYYDEVFMVIHNTTDKQIEIINTYEN